MENNNNSRTMPKGEGEKMDETKIILRKRRTVEPYETLECELIHSPAGWIAGECYIVGHKRVWGVGYDGSIVTGQHRHYKLPTLIQLAYKNGWRAV